MVYLQQGLCLVYISVFYKGGNSEIVMLTQFSLDY